MQTHVGMGQPGAGVRLPGGWPGPSGGLNEGSEEEEEVGHSRNSQQGLSCLKEAQERRLPRRGQAWRVVVIPVPRGAWGSSCRGCMTKPPGARWVRSLEGAQRGPSVGASAAGFTMADLESSVGTFIHMPSG